MQSKILTSLLMAGVLMAGNIALRAADTNAPAPVPPGATPAPAGANSAPPQGAAPRMRPLPPGGATGGPMSVLTEEQRTSFQKNLTDKRAEMMELSAKIRPLQQEVQEMLYSPKVDETQIRQKIAEEANIEADIMILRAKAFAGIQPPITDEQFEKFKQAEEAPPRQMMMRPTPPTAPAPTPAAPANPQSGPGKP